VTRSFTAAVVAVVAVVVLGACGSGGSTKATSSHSTTAASTRTPATVQGFGQGVTGDSVKVGVVLIDYNCVKDFVDSIRTQEKQTYQIYVDTVNARGGVAHGKKIVPVFKSYCPINGAAALQACTSLTEDDKVFAVIGSFYDPTGDAQACIAAQHHVPLISNTIGESTIRKAPGGLIVSPDITPERRLDVILSLLKKKPDILRGKKVSVVADSTAKPRVTSVVDPGLKALGVERGSDGLVTVTGSDTTAAQAQLDSFIERWKTEHVDALLLIGDDVSSKQFVEKIRRAIPGITLIADTTGVLSGAQDEQKAGVKPNPYDGIITAEGQTGAEHQKTKHGAYCRGIWEKATGRTMPAPNDIVKGPGGKREELYGEVEDGCLFTTMFATIADRVGVNLNSTNWVNAVNNFGPIDDTSTIYASIHAGKYDADDTYGLVAYDPTIPKLGDWRAVTPVQNVGGS
jgi:ABC-type branched-subunit amino acid transport system substrate-binding protein